MSRGSRARRNRGSIRTFGGGFRRWRPHLHPRDAKGKFRDKPDWYVPPRNRRSRLSQAGYVHDWQVQGFWKIDVPRSDFSNPLSGYRGEVFGLPYSSDGPRHPLFGASLSFDPNQDTTPIHLDTSMGRGATLGPEWFDLDEDGRKRAFYEAVGRTLSVPDEADAIFGAPDGVEDYRARSEAFAAAYGMLAMGEADDLDAAYPDLAPLVRREAVVAGFPVDDGEIAPPVNDSRIISGVENPLPERSEFDHDDPWRQAVNAMVSEGLVPPEDAAAVNALDDRVERWGPLPSTLWHVGTGTPDIIGEGFKSRFELSMTSGRGLAGGSKFTTSFTDDEVAARNIYSSMLEARAVAAGEVTVADLLDADERGEWGEPGAVMRKYGDTWVWGSNGPPEGGLEGVRAAVEAFYTRNGAALDGPGSDAAWSFYTSFSRSRQDAGGPMDPYYAGTDWRALAKVPTSDIAIIEVEPIEGAMGYAVPHEKEWRVASGDAVRITNAYKPDSELVPEPRTTLWRGLDMGSGYEDVQVAEIAADPERWVQSRLLTHQDRSDGLGIHWTDDASSAWNFAQGRPSGEWSDDFDPAEAGPWQAGIIIEGAAPERDVLIPGTREWEDWAQSEGIFDRDHPEREVTLTRTDDVTISAITVQVLNGETGESTQHRIDLDRLESMADEAPLAYTITDPDTGEIEAVSDGPDLSHRGLHQPNSDGPPAWNLLADIEGGEGPLLPDDVYDHPEWYTGTPQTDRAYVETVSALSRIRDDPNATVTIYRAAPEGVEFLPGDWVTLSRSYATDHGKHPDDPTQDMPVISMTVPADHVRFAGDDLMEYGWFPPEDWAPEAAPEPVPTRRVGEDDVERIVALGDEGRSLLFIGESHYDGAWGGRSEALAEWFEEHTSDVVTIEHNGYDAHNGEIEVWARRGAEDDYIQAGSIDLVDDSIYMDGDGTPEALNEIIGLLPALTDSTVISLRFDTDNPPPIFVDGHTAWRAITHGSIDTPGDFDVADAYLPDLVTAAQAAVADRGPDRNGYLHGILSHFPLSIYENGTVARALHEARSTEARRSAEAMGLRSTTLGDERDVKLEAFYGDHFEREVRWHATDTPLIQARQRWEFEGGGEDFETWWYDNYRDAVVDHFGGFSTIGRKSGTEYHTYASIEVFDDGGFGVAVTFMDEHGDEVGESKREFSPDGTVYHALLALDESIHGDGLATAWNRHNDPWYLANGYGEVTVSAALSDGGYQWAGDFFETDPRTKRNYLRGIGRAAQDAVDSPSTSRADRVSAIQALADVAEMEALFESGEDVPFWEIAHAGLHDEVRESRNWVGRRTLRGQSWSGHKNLAELAGIEVPTADTFLPNYEELTDAWRAGLSRRADITESWVDAIAEAGGRPLTPDGVLDLNGLVRIRPVGDGYMHHVERVDNEETVASVLAGASAVTDSITGTSGTDSVIFGPDVPTDVQESVMARVNEIIDSNADDVPGFLDEYDARDAFEDLDDGVWARRSSTTMFSDVVPNTDTPWAIFDERSLGNMLGLPAMRGDLQRGDHKVRVLRPVNDDNSLGEPLYSIRRQVESDGTVIMDVERLRGGDSATEESQDATLLAILNQTAPRPMITFEGPGDPKVISTGTHGIEGFPPVISRTAEGRTVRLNYPSSSPYGEEPPVRALRLGGTDWTIKRNVDDGDHQQVRLTFTGFEGEGFPTGDAGREVASRIADYTEQNRAAETRALGIYSRAGEWESVTVEVPDGVEPTDLIERIVDPLLAQHGVTANDPEIEGNEIRWRLADIAEATKRAQREREAAADDLRAQFVEWRLERGESLDDEVQGEAVKTSWGGYYFGVSADGGVITLAQRGAGDGTMGPVDGFVGVVTDVFDWAKTQSPPPSLRVEVPDSLGGAFRPTLDRLQEHFEVERSGSRTGSLIRRSRGLEIRGSRSSSEVDPAVVEAWREAFIASAPDLESGARSVGLFTVSSPAEGWTQVAYGGGNYLAALRAVRALQDVAKTPNIRIRLGNPEMADALRARYVEAEGYDPAGPWGPPVWTVDTPYVEWFR